MVDVDRMKSLPGENVEQKRVHFRILRCYSHTGGVD